MKGVAKKVRDLRIPRLRPDRGQPVRAGKGAQGTIEGHEQQVGGERRGVERTVFREGSVEARGGCGEKRLLLLAHVPRVLVVEALYGEGGGEPAFRSGRAGGGFGRTRVGPLSQTFGPCRGQQTLELRIEVDHAPEIVEEQPSARGEEPRRRRAVVRRRSPDPKLGGRRRAKLRTHPGLDEEPAHVRRRLDGEHLGQNATQRFPDLARPAFAGGPSRGRGRSGAPAGRPPRCPTAPEPVRGSVEPPDRPEPGHEPP